MVVQPEVPSEVYVSFSAEINANTTEALLGAMANIATQGIPKVKKPRANKPLARKPNARPPKPPR